MSRDSFADVRLILFHLPTTVKLCPLFSTVSTCSLVRTSTSAPQKTQRLRPHTEDLVAALLRKKRRNSSVRVARFANERIIVLFFYRQGDAKFFWVSPHRQFTYLMCQFFFKTPRTLLQCYNAPTQSYAHRISRESPSHPGLRVIYSSASRTIFQKLATKRAE